MTFCISVILNVSIHSLEEILLRETLRSKSSLRHEFKTDPACDSIIKSFSYGITSSAILLSSICFCFMQVPVITDLYY